jgi:hypothetical protein
MYELQTEIREQKSLFDIDANDEAEIYIEDVRMPESLFNEEPEQGHTKMQNSDLPEQPKSEKRKGFWRRQFQEPTKAQYKFDWMFGVIMPVICIFFDPGIFSSHTGGWFLLGAYKPFAYLLSFTAIIAMMAWLIWGEHLRWLNALFAGLFLVSGAVALIIGIVLFPISLVGLVIVIGALGFTPLFTGIVYLRNGLRAIKAAKPFLARNTLAYSIILSSLAFGVVPYVINVEIYRSLERIKTGDAKTIRTEGIKLWAVKPLVDAGQLVPGYRLRFMDEKEINELNATADVYHDLTGKDIKRPWISVWDY